MSLTGNPVRALRNFWIRWAVVGLLFGGGMAVMLLFKLIPGTRTVPLGEGLAFCAAAGFGYSAVMSVWFEFITRRFKSPVGASPLDCRLPKGARSSVVICAVLLAAGLVAAVWSGTEWVLWATSLLALANLLHHLAASQSRREAAGA